MKSPLQHLHFGSFFLHLLCHSGFHCLWFSFLLSKDVDQRGREPFDLQCFLAPLVLGISFSRKGPWEFEEDGVKASPGGSCKDCASRKLGTYLGGAGYWGFNHDWSQGVGKYLVPNSYHFHVVWLEDHVTTCLLDWLAIYEEFLKAGFWFLLHPFVISIFDFYEVILAQLMPNSF